MAQNRPFAVLRVSEPRDAENWPFCPGYWSIRWFRSLDPGCFRKHEAWLLCWRARSTNTVARNQAGKSRLGRGIWAAKPT